MSGLGALATFTLFAACILLSAIRMPKDDPRQPYFFWIDLEMTGLHAATDRILEAAVIVTDHEWHEVETYETAVWQPAEVLAGMGDWCQRHHRASGLLDRVPEGINEVELDAALEGLCEQYWGSVPVILCGNSIHQDRKFIDHYLPLFGAKLHYRMLDVSSFKVAFKELYGVGFEKKNSHRALDDIRESLAEFRYYLKAIHPDSFTGTE